MFIGAKNAFNKTRGEKSNWQFLCRM